jgi:hypothetical protein
MLATRVFLVATLALGAGSCGRLSPHDAEVVGTWQFRSYNQPKRIRLERDHKATVLQHTGQGDDDLQFSPISRGTWKLDGNRLIVDVDFISMETEVPKVMTPLTIREFSQSKLVLDTGAVLTRVQ